MPCPRRLRLPSAIHDVQLVAPPEAPHSQRHRRHAQQQRERGEPVENDPPKISHVQVFEPISSPHSEHRSQFARRSYPHFGQHPRRIRSLRVNCRCIRTNVGVNDTIAARHRLRITAPKRSHALHGSRPRCIRYANAPAASIDTSSTLHPRMNNRLPKTS